VVSVRRRRQECGREALPFRPPNIRINRQSVRPPYGAVCPRKQFLEGMDNGPFPIVPPDSKTGLAIPFAGHPECRAQLHDGIGQQTQRILTNQWIWRVPFALDSFLLLVAPPPTCIAMRIVQGPHVFFFRLGAYFFQLLSNQTLWLSIWIGAWGPGLLVPPGSPRQWHVPLEQPGEMMRNSSALPCHPHYADPDPTRHEVACGCSCCTAGKNPSAKESSPMVSEATW